MIITQEILDEGKGKDGYTDAQLRLFGFTEDNQANWQEKVLGDEMTQYKVKMFLGLKDWVFVDTRILKINEKLEKK